MKTKKFIQRLAISSILLMACFCYNPFFAQVAINTDGTPPDGSAMLEVKSTEKGVLLPRMTQTEIEDITNPANGLIVYNTDDNHFYYFDDAVGRWKEIAIGTRTILPGGFDCGDALVDARDDRTYTTVEIGTQCWMAENLKYEPLYDKWWYDNSSANGDVYGRLYTWNAARLACPFGWHLPTDAEWTTLTDYLGGTSVAGGKLKEKGTTHWKPPNTGAINSSGFTALPGGYRLYSGGGSFWALGFQGWWWSATRTNIVGAWVRGMDNTKNGTIRTAYHEDYGLSVRCVRD